jgi:hypothetical protein
MPLGIFFLYCVVHVECSFVTEAHREETGRAFLPSQLPRHRGLLTKPHPQVCLLLNLYIIEVYLRLNHIIAL